MNKTAANGNETDTPPRAGGEPSPPPMVVAERYEIERQLGHGGMGRVFVGYDRKLGRKVAIKMLKAGVHPEEALRRFELEARAAGSLNNAYILDVHDIGIWRDEPYIVTELLEGETVGERLRRGRMPLEEAIGFALHLAQGLCAAHEKGVIHRDLKPDNLFITKDDRLKILDFGIAKLVAPPLPDPGETTPSPQPQTETGAIMGTVGYMSPEQVRGHAVDHRSDLFSYGTIFYEMLSGRAAFERATPVETGYAILNSEPPELPQQVSPEIERIVRHCLEKNPQDRFQSARDLVHELQRLTSGVAPIGHRTRRSLVDRWLGLRSRRSRTLARTVAIVLACAGGAFVVHRVRTGGVPQAPGPSIAVLPFADLSPSRDQEYFSDGLGEEILDALAHVEGLRVAGRTSSFSFKGKAEDIKSIAQKLNVSAVLEGSIRREGTRIRVTAQLINAADGFHVWSQIFDREVTGIFAVQEEISTAVVQALRIKLLPGRTSPPPARRTTPEAHAEYLIGRQLFNRGTPEGHRLAEAAFARAVKLDPNYAPAWAGLASAAYYWANFAPPAEVEDAKRRAVDAAKQAVSLGPELSGAWAIRGLLRALMDHDWQGAEADLKNALRLSSGDAYVWGRYGVLLASLGRLPEGLVAVRKAAELDPLSSEAWDNLGYVATASGDLATGRSASARALEIAPGQVYATRNAAVVDLLEGHPERALATYEKSGEKVVRLQVTAMAQHDLGRAAESQRALDELAAEHGHGSAFEIAQVYAWRGDRDRAFEWLERGYLHRDGGLGYLKCDPLLRKIRDDPRYAALLRKMKLPE